MELLKIIVMITLAIMSTLSLCIYLLRKDILISHFQLHIGVKGIDLDIKVKEKSDPPSKSDRFKHK